MAEDNDLRSDTDTIVSEIENQLADILENKKKEVTRSMEEKIQKEQEEAQKEIDQIENEYKKEKEGLNTYRSLFVEFENKRTGFREKIKSHLNKATSFQGEISSLTTQTLDELQSVNEINREMADFKSTSRERMTSIKKDLQEKYGITTSIPKEDTKEEMDLDLEQELSKLTKIKELLGDKNDMEPQEPPVPEKIEPQAEYEIVESQAGFEPPVPEKTEPQADYEMVESQADFEPKIDPLPDPVDEPEIKIEQDIEIIEENTPQIDVEKLSVEENVLSDLQNMNEMKNGTNFEQVFETLEKYRKGSCTEDNGDVSYFKKNNRIIIDGECLISTLANSLEGAKKLYKQLSKTESPKEQFFIKQDIIRYQEVLRKLMLVAIRMCEQEACSLPKYTMEILNVDILKSILEKVSMENWSDQEDFTSFNDYAKSLKDSYYEKITPPAKYIDSIINELEIN
jgi:hypothetical protein